MARKIDPIGDGGGGRLPPPDRLPSPPPPPPPPAFQPAYYIFRLDSFTITETRSAHNDTDHVTIGLKVGDKVFDPQTKHMADVNNGTHQVGLEIGPVLVDAPTTPIAFNYQIVNNGHASYADIESNLAAGAVALTAHVFSSTFWTMIMGVVSKWIWGFIFADCDGPVAVDQFQWTGQDLWNMTHGVGTLSQSKFYPGIDSPWGCGGNSKYYVQWSLAGAGVTTQRVFVISSVSEVFVSA